MSSKTAKNTRATPRRATNKTKAAKADSRPTLVEQAKALIDAASNGALREANPDPSGLNPYIQSSGARDTVYYVRCSLELMSQLSLRDAGIGMNKDLEFGQFLILQTMVKALQAVDGQIQHDTKLALARAIVEAAEGAQ